MTSLPSFRRGELAKIKAAELGAVVILDVGGRIAIGTTTDPRAYARHYAATKAPCRLVYVGWALDPAIARRIRSAAAVALSGRKIGDGTLFDVPLPLAVSAVEIAARKIGPGLRSTSAALADIQDQKEQRAQAMMRRTVGYMI